MPQIKIKVIACIGFLIFAECLFVVLFDCATFEKCTLNFKTLVIMLCARFVLQVLAAFAMLRVLWPVMKTASLTSTASVSLAATATEQTFSASQQEQKQEHEKQQSLLQINTAREDEHDQMKIKVQTKTPNDDVKVDVSASLVETESIYIPTKVKRTERTVKTNPVTYDRLRQWNKQLLDR